MEALKVVATFVAFAALVVLVVLAITCAGAWIGKLTFSPEVMP